MRLTSLLILTCTLTLALVACQPGEPATKDAHAGEPAAAEKTQLAPKPKEGDAVATFGGGCFWCMEGIFEYMDGVHAALAGYTGGPETHPSYKQVSSGKTGHTEAVIVYYDPKKVSYEKLLETYWKNMDPTDAGGQFADRGQHYRPVIFYHTPEQQKIALASKAALSASKRFDKPIVVPIQPAQDFWVAEEYHQNFYKTNAEHYNRYKVGSGRAGFIKDKWGE